MLNTILNKVNKVLEDRAKAKQRHLNDVAWRIKQEQQDPFNLNGLAFTSQDEGKTFTRSDNYKQAYNTKYTNTECRIITFRVVNGKPQILNIETKNFYKAPKKDIPISYQNNTVCGSLGFVKQPKR